MLPDSIRQTLERLTATYSFTGEECKGGNGFVFFATNRVTGVHVAIKFYWWGDHPELHAEPRLLAQFNCENVVPILIAELVGGGWAMFATPQFAGDLESAISRERFSLHRTLDAIRGVYSGLGALHGAGIVHRDLKPANVLISDRGTVAIGDFGSVATLSLETQDAVASHHSILYRPPESFAENRYTKAGDLYQVGMLMHEMLAGPLPSLPADWVPGRKMDQFLAIVDECEQSLFVDREISARIVAGTILRTPSLPFCVPRRVRSFLKAQTSTNVAARSPSTADAVASILDLRRGSLDWHFDDAAAVGAGLGVSVRVEVVAGRAECYVNRGNGYRRDRSLESETPSASCELANARFSR